MFLPNSDIKASFEILIMKEIKLTWIFVCKLSKVEFESILPFIPISFLPLFVLFIWNKDLRLIIFSFSFLFLQYESLYFLLLIKEKLKLSSNILLLFLELFKIKEDNSSSLFFHSQIYIYLLIKSKISIIFKW